jgi:outer membrane protein assembly factor BamB
MAALKRGGADIDPQRGTPYGMSRAPFLSPSGVPCVKPPFGRFTAVDAATGETRWQIPLGWMPRLAAATPEAKGWGSITLGGPITTAAGLVFVAATVDAHLRALDVETGRELWAAPLPTAAFSTPMTYEAGGRQFVVVAAGGHDKALSFAPTGDWLVAFALPADPAPQRADTISSAGFGGEWTGDLRVGDQRFPATLSLRVSGDSVRGPLHGAAGGLSFGGEVMGAVRDGQLRWRVAFRETSTGCSGTIEGSGVLANEGAMLSSRLSADSNCGEGGVSAGAFGLRRPGAPSTGVPPTR